ncbi:MAG TPA: hypothetical protein VK597_04735 [Inquilinus sp.]|nr:hypothetical protein [Inquilinus sp.]
MAVTALQHRVARHHLDHGNATRAAIEAGSKAKDPAKAGCVILHKPHVLVARA